MSDLQSKTTTINGREVETMDNFMAFVKDTIKGRAVLVGLTQDGSKWYFHEECGAWFPKFDGVGGDHREYYMKHRCSGITPETLLFPHVAELRAKVKAQSERLAAGK